MPPDVENIIEKRAGLGSTYWNTEMSNIMEILNWMIFALFEENGGQGHSNKCSAITRMLGSSTWPLKWTTWGASWAPTGPSPSARPPAWPRWSPAWAWPAWSPLPGTDTLFASFLPPTFYNVEFLHTSHLKMFGSILSDTCLQNPLQKWWLFLVTSHAYFFSLCLKSSSDIYEIFHMIWLRL